MEHPAVLGDVRAVASAGCVEKSRWSILAPTTTKPLSIDCDSFARSNGIDAKRSQSMDTKQQPSTQPLFLVSYSAHMDQELYRFSDGTHDLTTTHVMKVGGDLLPDPAALCADSNDNCSCYTRYHLVEDVGTVLSGDDATGKLVTQYQQNQQNPDPLFATLVTYTSHKHDLCATAPPRPTLPPRSQPQAVPEGFLFITPPNAHDVPTSAIQTLALVVQTTGGNILTGHSATIAIQANSALPACPVLAGTCLLGYVLQRTDTAIPAVRDLVVQLSRSVGP